MQDDKYTMLDTRGPSSGMGGGPGYSAAVESSFKHYVDADGVGMGGGPPEVINVTSGGGTILPPDQVIDVSRAPSLATLNGAGATSVAGAGTLPRASTLSNRHENKMQDTNCLININFVVFSGPTTAAAGRLRGTRNSRYFK